MQEIYRVKTSPVALSDNMITGEKYRITFLTEALVRLEYSEDGVFEDRATQTVLFRDFPKTDYHVVRNADGIEVHTSMLHLIYNEKEFSSHGLSIQIKGNLSAYHSIWHYGEKVDDLQGTARTLDDVNGATELGHGVVSRFGYSILDDSKSQILLDDGWIEPRKKGVSDLYFFGYGHEYKQALNDFYRLCGKTPMLPRYALGNWWSRYYKYSEESYMELMDRFDEKNIPFTVAVIDMDWHQVETNRHINGKKPKIAGKSVQHTPPLGFLPRQTCQLSVRAVIMIGPHQQKDTNKSMFHIRIIKHHSRTYT